VSAAGVKSMATIAEWEARRRASFFRLYAEGLLTANELFPGLLDSFSEDRILEELEASGAAIRERVREFLAAHRPATFKPFVVGQPIAADETLRWEQDRRRKYAALTRTVLG
jgi:hypothetical protein